MDVNAAAPPWDDMKAAFSFDGYTERLWRAEAEGRLTLPDGWSLCETDGSGARVVAVFRVEVIPTAADAYKVKAQLRRFR